MIEVFLEIALLKCPNCGNLLVEPTWFLELESDITCQVCRKTWQAKRAVLDKKMLKFEVSGEKLISVSFSK